ncbi:MAG: DMT family transporter [Betaproteobacteria bacterium]|nr:DMT family transporter [Betaproteobacteria bacterium]
MTPDFEEKAARDRLAWTLLMLAPMLWSANMLVARWSADWFPPHALAFWRWLVALAPMLVICGAVLWRRRAEALAEWRDLLLLGALGMWVCGAFVYIASATTSATNIGLIYAGVPVLVMLLSAAIFRERLHAVQVAGAAVALVGVLAIIVRGDVRFLLSLDFTVGDLWTLAAACCWAIYSVLMRYRPSRLDPFLRLTAVTIAGVLILAPLTLAEAIVTGSPPLEWRSLAAALIVGLLPGFGAYQAYSWLLREVGAARSSLVLYLTPVYTALLSWLLLGEAIRSYHLAGGVLVLGGVWLASRGATGRT